MKKLKISLQLEFICSLYFCKYEFLYHGLQCPSDNISPSYMTRYYPQKNIICEASKSIEMNNRIELDQHPKQKSTQKSLLTSE